MACANSGWLFPAQATSAVVSKPWQPLPSVWERLTLQLTSNELNAVSAVHRRILFGLWRMGSGGRMRESGWNIDGTK